MARVLRPQLLVSSVAIAPVCKADELVEGVISLRLPWGSWPSRLPGVL